MSESNGNGASPIVLAALDLARECPTHLNADCHVGCRLRHFRCPVTGRVGCYTPGRLTREYLPEDWLPTEAQQALDRLLATERPAPVGEAGPGH